MKTLPILLGFLFFASPLFGQFESVNQDFGIYVLHEDTEWGNGASFYDYNHDGWDDLTTANGDSAIQFFQNDGTGNLIEVELDLPEIQYAQVKAVVWVDYDNDGDSDLFFSQYGGRLYLLNNDGNLSFTDVTAEVGISTASYNYYGVAFGDVNKDGHLDFYISKYYNPSINPQSEFSSVFYLNTGNGTFVDNTIAAGLFQSPSPSFQSVFFDYNADGYLDIYIIVDRAMWPNELFINNGNGTFTEVSDLLGAAVGVDSMCASPGDYDNDLDLDLYLADGSIGNVLLQNNFPNNFQNRASSMGVTVNKICWGSNWLDVDNDGWQDLFVSTTVGLFTSAPNVLLKNNGPNGFTEMSQVWGIGTDNSPSMCNVIGDFNNDGNFDYYNNNNYPSYSDLWLSSTSTNNFISLTFEGTVSNKDAVGTVAEVFFNGMQNIRLKQFGESYLAQNSGKEIVGLGSASIVDSLIIKWPSGLTDKYFNIIANDHYHFIEGQSTPEPFELIASDLTICPSQQIILDGGEAAQWLWNTGYDQRYLTVTEPGTYQVQVTNEFGLSYLTNTIVIESQAAPSVSIEMTNPTCSGYTNGSIELSFTYEENTLIYLNNEVTSNLISNLGAGTYEYQVISQSGCLTSDQVSLVEPSALSAEFSITQPMCSSNFGLVEVTDITGGIEPYTTDFLGIDPTSIPAGDYLFLVIDNQGCPFVGNYEIIAPLPLELTVTTTPQIDDLPGTISFSSVGGTGVIQYLLDDQPITEVNTIEAQTGTHFITAIDENGCSVTNEVFVGFEVGIESFNQTFSIQPNPASTEMTVVVDSDLISQSIEVFSATGQLIYSKKINSFSSKIDCSKWSEGIYVLSIGNQQQKLIIQ